MILERITTSRAEYSADQTKRGAIRYRKNGKFVSARVYNAARSSRYSDVTTIRKPADDDTLAILARAGAQGSYTPRTAWIIEGDKAGKYASQVIPGLRRGKKLTEAQRKKLMGDVRLVHGYEAFALKRSDLSPEKALKEYLRMMKKLRKLKTAAARERTRIEFGLSGGSGFDAKHSRR